MGRKKTVYEGYPEYLICTVTGTKTKANPSQIKHYLETHGIDLETYLKNYVCRSAKKDIKDSKVKTEPSPPKVHKEKIYIEQNAKLFAFCNERKELIKKLWLKVSEHPPEYYQEKIKLAVKK